MRVGLLTDLHGQRVWHRWLAADLSRAGHELVLVHASDAIKLPAGLQLALLLDPVMFRLKGEHAFDAVPAKSEQPEFHLSDAPALDLLIDASASGDPRPRAQRVVRLTFNGDSSELGAIAAVLNHEGPAILAIDDETSGQRETARCGFAQKRCLTSALDNLFSSAVELLSARADSGPIPQPWTIAPGNLSGFCSLANSASPRAGSRSGLTYLRDRAIKKVSNYLSRHLRTQNSWAIAVRTCPGAGLVEGAWPSAATFAIVPDDGERYFADPFLFEREGRRYLFAEEFPRATQRGIISVAELDASGMPGPFRPVLERDTHLSYPFVFSYGEDIWMIPESCESGGVDLFRAVQFPDRWAFDRRLLEGVHGCDATIFHVGDYYYMTLTTKRWLATTWDNQRMFRSRSPLGPWSEHDGGLVRIDCTMARPGGLAFVRDARLLRPAQNSSAFYGGSMTVLDIGPVTGDEIDETPVATIKVTGPANAIGTHTYAKCGSIEAVDVYGDVRKIRQVEITCAPSPDATSSEAPQRGIR